MAHHEKIYATFEIFNQDVAQLSKDPGAAAELEGCAENLFPEKKECAGVRASGLPPALQWLRRLFATADLLANRYQRKSNFFLAMMILFAAVAGGSLDLYHGLHTALQSGPYSAILAGQAAGWGISFVMCSSVVVGMLVRTLRGQDQDRYLAYRSLAESLRVQFFWKLAGVGETVTMHFKGRDFRALDWIRSAADVAWRLTGTHLGEAQPPGDWRCWRHCVRRQWVADQRRYFIRSHRREVSRRDRHEHAVGLTLRTAGLMAVFSVALGPFSLSETPAPAWLVALAAAGLLFSAGLLTVNLFCCTLWGEKPPKRAAAGRGCCGSSAPAGRTSSARTFRESSLSSKAC